MLLVSLEPHTTLNLESPQPHLASEVVYKPII